MGSIFNNCNGIMDKICLVVALIGMVAGMLACSYTVYTLLKLINAPDSIQVLSAMFTMPLVGYCFNRFETIIHR